MFSAVFAAFAVAGIGLATPPAAAQAVTDAEAQIIAALTNLGDAEFTPVRVPEVVVGSAFLGGAEDMQAVGEFLRAGNATPDLVARRTVSLIRALRESRFSDDPSVILAAADRVSEAARQALDVAKIVRLTIDFDYTPPTGAVALDFGPPDGETRDGFTPIVPSDPALGGAAMSGVHQPGDGTLPTDGIRGLETVEIALPNGVYRIILMTEDLGEADIMLSPFGQTVTVNGVATEVDTQSPDEWLQTAYMTNQPTDFIAAAQSEAETPAGIAAQNQNAPRINVESESAGVIVINAVVTDGRLRLAMAQPPFATDRATYLTGMVVEPIVAGQDSSVKSYLSSIDSALSPEKREALLSRIEATVASLLQQLQPALGPEEPEEEPEDTLVEQKDSASLVL